MRTRATSRKYDKPGFLELGVSAAKTAPDKSEFVAAWHFEKGCAGEPSNGEKMKARRPHSPS